MLGHVSERAVQATSESFWSHITSHFLSINAHQFLSKYVYNYISNGKYQRDSAQYETHCENIEVVAKAYLFIYFKFCDFQPPRHLKTQISDMYLHQAFWYIWLFVYSSAYWSEWIQWKALVLTSNRITKIALRQASRLHLTKLYAEMVRL